jgi:hypothetical protein
MPQMITKALKTGLLIVDSHHFFGVHHFMDVTGKMKAVMVPQ